MISLEQFVNRPLAIAALTLAGSISGGWLKDRLQSEGAEAANSVRIQHLETEVERLGAESVRQAEFRQFAAAVLEQLRDIKQRLR
jgi:hypothetical protein